jgi:hypothetical protein
MTQAPKHAQFTMNTALKDHLINNGDTLSELLVAYADINAMAALSPLPDGSCHQQEQRDERAHINPRASIPPPVKTKSLTGQAN